MLSYAVQKILSQQEIPALSWCCTHQLLNTLFEIIIFSIISTLGGKTEKEYDRLKPAPLQHRCDSPVAKNPA